MSEREFHLTVWQNDSEVAGVSGADFERVYADAMHYAFVYGQDGPTEIRGIPADRMKWLTDRLSGSPSLK